MKRKFYKIVSLFILMFLVSSQAEAQRGRPNKRPANSSFLAGAEFQFQRLGEIEKSKWGRPDTVPDTVLVKFYMYRNCAFQRANPNYDPKGTAITVVRFSNKCCEYTLDTLVYDERLSGLSASPLCPTAEDGTQCGTNPSTALPGYQTEVFIDTIILRCKADDWKFGFLYSTEDYYSNFYPYDGPYNLFGLGSANEQLTATTWLPTWIGQPPNANPPGIPFVCRDGSLNTVSSQILTDQSFLYIEAIYSNNIIIGSTNTVPPVNKTIANTSPVSVASPLIFQCKNVQRTYDLGYYDLDGHYMTFEPTEVYKDVIASGTSNNLTTTGVPLIYNSGFGATDPLGTTGGSFYNINQYTGEVTFMCTTPGSYKTGVKIKEYLKDPAVITGQVPIGETTRDVIITIIEDAQCTDTNYIANSAHFLKQSLFDFQNCRDAPNRKDMVEACAGSNISFSLPVYSTSSNPGASILVDYVLSPELNKNDSSTSYNINYHNNVYPTYDTAIVTFNWKIPDTIPPGQYWVMFQVNYCISAYILSRNYIVYIRINNPTKIYSRFQNFSPSIGSDIFSFPNTDTVTYCDNRMKLALTADNGISDAYYNWYTLTSGITSNPLDQNINDNKYNEPVITNLADSGVQKIMVISNQYCNNVDTLTIINHMKYNPKLTLKIRDSCLNTVGLIKIDSLPTRFLMDWQASKSDYARKPSYYSDVAAPIVKNTDNRYEIYAYLVDDRCPYYLDTAIKASGIKPKGKYTTDKSYICPYDTIKSIQLRMTTAICGKKTDFSQASTVLKTAQFNSTASNFDSIPKIFTSNNSIDRIRTQVLYRASDLRKNGFKGGIVSKIGFNIDGISSPKRYNNVVIRVTCTSRSDLQDLRLEDTSSMITIASLNFIILQKGWNKIPLGNEFTWDDSTNLIFDISSSCNFPDPKVQPTPPSFVDRVTNYISTIGKYGKGLIGYNAASVVGSNYCPDISFDYYELNDTLTYTWKDISTTPAYLSIIKDTSTTPKFVSNVPRNVQVEVRNKKCFMLDTIPVIYDTNFSIKLKHDDSLKCPGDSIQIDAAIKYPLIRPMVLTCGVENNPEDTCRIYDSKTKPFIGNIATTVGDASISPFGGTGALTSAVTDKRLQFILPYRELSKTIGMQPGFIDSITFIVSNLAANANKLSNFSIKFKCIPDTMEIFYGKTFESFATFEEVYTSSAYTPVAGDNSFKLNKRFAWNGKTGLMVDVCFDNATGSSYNSSIVKGTLFTSAKTYYKSSNLGDASVGCNFDSASVSNYRPDIKLSMCLATKPLPPIPSSVDWAPTTFINNTKIYNPIIYNISTTDYYVIQRYIDTNYGQNKVVCIVRDTFYSKVNRPLAEFNKPVACAGDSAITIIGIKDTADNLYSFKWDTTQIGVNKLRYTNPKQAIYPNSPGYYRVYFYETNKPNCYNLDSVYVDIQNRSIMPNIGGPSQLCVGDTIRLNIPTSIGYKKPVWTKNNNYVDTGYTLLVSDTGTFVVYIDSGVCRNYSNNKVVSFRPVDTATINISDAIICEGDTAVLFYNLTAGIANPVWNTGSTSLMLKVTQPGIYYIVNPKTQYGCLFKTNDTAKVQVVNNPDFKLNSDTICMSANGKVVLQPSPYDADATYDWQPVNYKGSSYEATTPGTYIVTRTKGNCQKVAQTFVVNDTPGTLDLGPNRAICCDEILTLNANPQNLQKYKSYKWSTDEKSQFIYTKPNSSGKYIVEAFKPNGCRDTGFIFIKALCANVQAQVQHNSIRLGEVNPIIGNFDTLPHVSYTYEWKSPDPINQVVNPNILNAITKPGDTGDVEYILTMQIHDSTYMPPKPNCIENAVVRYKVKANSIELIDWFSPNQDGDRDVFWPVIDGNVKITDFKVYNRFGQMIHNETIPWDGKFKGEPQPIGAYVGLITYEANSPRKPGQITQKQISISLFR